MDKTLESEISKSDIKSIFKGAITLRDKPTGLGRFFKGLRKDKIDILDLQQSWKDDGFPDDIRDISNILLGYGFSIKEINKVVKNVLDNDESDDDDLSIDRSAIIKIAEFARKRGIDQRLIEFLKKEYNFNESIFFDGKVVVEDIRQIFSKIILEERSARASLIKEQDNKMLGRMKK